MWQLMDLSSILILLKLLSIRSHAAIYDFWHDFAGKGVLNFLGEVLPK